ncbi:MAG: hypothetical protein ACI81P_003142 [Neolewinella sp.]|jgi:hypothetical protein
MASDLGQPALRILDGREKAGRSANQVINIPLHVVRSRGGLNKLKLCLVAEGQTTFVEGDG